MIMLNKDVRYAYKLIDLAAQKSKDGNPYGYVCILNGIGISRVGSNLDKEHNYKAVVDAIHLYDRDNPDKMVAHDYGWTIIITIQALAGLAAIDKLFNILYYELEKEKNGTNTFVLNFELIIEELENFAKTKNAERGYCADIDQRINKLKYTVYEVQSNLNSYPTARKGR